MKILTAILCLWAFALGMPTALQSQSFQEYKFQQNLNLLLNPQTAYEKKEAVIKEVLTQLDAKPQAKILGENGTELDLLEAEEFLFRLQFGEYGPVAEYDIRLESQSEIVLQFVASQPESYAPKLQLPPTGPSPGKIALSSGLILSGGTGFTLACLRRQLFGEIQTEVGLVFDGTLDEGTFLEKWNDQGFTFTDAGSALEAANQGRRTMVFVKVAGSSLALAGLGLVGLHFLKKKNKRDYQPGGWYTLNVDGQGISVGYRF
ncbi:MAG: hypothetical protein AAFR61_05440 [Bacteroidota bacterium]